MASTSFVGDHHASSSLIVPKRYDVFISFRGEDTRVDFTSHLHAALCRKNIDPYIDNNIQKGKEVWAELLKAIKDSSLFLVIFSENYASSSWCLNELVELMECKKQEQDGVHVIPVFYKVDPSHVRKQTGSYGIAFAEHEKDGKVSEDKIQQWKNTLYKAANISGFHSNQYRTEHELIEGIIKDVWEKLNHKYTNTFTSHFIRDENYTKIESLLNSKEVRVIGIWGMGGIGKTTLAAAIYHKVSSQYDGACFFENVARESEKDGVNHLCNKLFSKLLREDIDIDTPKVIPSDILKRLKRKKVFIVLDGVNTSELLENLVVGNREWLGAGSKVIVTTRDKHILTCGDVDEIHEVKQMNFQNSLKLFSFNAFRKTCPPEKYEDLSNRAMEYAKGIPLASKVLGSFLRSKSEKVWDDALNRLRESPNPKVQEVLKLSYDGLENDEKEIFLDIACFFKGKMQNVIKILKACGFHVDIGINSLLDKALISISDHLCIDMHDLIQDMGRDIVRKESKNPGERSRLWNPEDIYQVLTDNSGTAAVEGIWLDMTQIENINLDSEAFKKMPNLRLLVFKGEYGKISSIHFSKGLEFLPKNLKYIEWDGYPLESLPSTVCPQKLVELRLHHSNVKRLWQGVQNLPNLEEFSLLDCKHLVECPNLSGAPKLTFVKMSGCESLSSVDPSILSLPKLQILDLERCTSLETLTSTSNICSKSLSILFLRDTGLSELPPSILHRRLSMFTSSISHALVNLPENFASIIWLTDSREHKRESFIILQEALRSPGFQSLVGLEFKICLSVRVIPDNIRFLSSLIHLSLDGCSIICLPESIKDLPLLLVLEVKRCTFLNCIPELPPRIGTLCVWGCPCLTTVLRIRSMNSKGVFLLPNCINLYQYSCDTILNDTINRIDLGLQSAQICYPLSAGSGKVRELFHCHFTDASVPIEQLLPVNVLGFVFYLVVPPVQSCHIGCCGSIGCEVYLETSLDGKQIKIKSIFQDKCAMSDHPTSFEYMTDHVFLWYDGEFCKQIMKAINERQASISGDPKLTLKFFAKLKDNKEAVKIKECGIRWIYSAERARKSKCSFTANTPAPDTTKDVQSLKPVDKGKQKMVEQSREFPEISFTASKKIGESSGPALHKKVIPSTDPSTKSSTQPCAETSNLGAEEKETLRWCRYLEDFMMKTEHAMDWPQLIQFWSCCRAMILLHNFFQSRNG